MSNNQDELRLGSKDQRSRWELPKEMRYPISADEILRKRQSLGRRLRENPNQLASRIAILGGSTTHEVRSILELFLLANGIRPTFYESQYNAYYEEVMFDDPSLKEFKPEVVFIHTTCMNLSRYPQPGDSEADVDALLAQEVAKFNAYWDKIESSLGAVIVQNNFDLPRERPLGNLDSSAVFGRINYVTRLNQAFAERARRDSRFFVNDIQYLSAQVGLTQWFDFNCWYSYHMAVSPTGSVALAQSVAAIIKASYGKSKKCLVLDLDNTLWGGVVGDDGVENLQLGRDHPVGEAYQSFQRYAKSLRDRGILLAVCSKNDVENAKAGFSHPDSVLKLDDFSAFKANWNPKCDNIREIAHELNIGLDSFVFVDDNPVERAIVAAQIPEVSVPEVGVDVTLFAEALQQEAFFEPVKILKDDLERSGYYSVNVKRNLEQARCADYGEFLSSLEMCAEIGSFRPVYLERITQLTNKTNQFNLTTRRYTAGEITAIAGDPGYITLYGRLRDKFGDNGLVTVVIGAVDREQLHVDLWLMSCRVLKREMEYAMFDALVEQCRERGIKAIHGTYLPTKKNGMVAELYGSFGFTKLAESSPERSLWRYEIPAEYTPKAVHIGRDMPAEIAVCAS